MNVVHWGSRRFVYRWMLTSGLLLHAASHWTLSANAQSSAVCAQCAAPSPTTPPKTCPPPLPPTNPGCADCALAATDCSDYSLVTTSLKIEYRTYRHPLTGVIQLTPFSPPTTSHVPGGRTAPTTSAHTAHAPGGHAGHAPGGILAWPKYDPAQIEIKWNTCSGAPPAEWILVEFQITCHGVSGTYTTQAAVKRDGDTYKIPVQNLVRRLMEDLNDTLCFDPCADECLQCQVVVKVTPIYLVPTTTPAPDPANLAATTVTGWTYASGHPTQTTNTLNLTLERVLAGGGF
jgi:hypothetical protein